MIDKDEFEAWKEIPATRYVFEVLRRKAQEAKQNWLSASWDQGISDPVVLADLRASAQAWEYVYNLAFEEVEAVLEHSR